MRAIYEPDAKILTILFEETEGWGYWQYTKCPQIMLRFSQKDGKVTAIKIWRVDWSPTKIDELQTKVGFGGEIKIDLL